MARGRWSRGPARDCASCRRARIEAASAPPRLAPASREGNWVDGIAEGREVEGEGLGLAVR